jgi:hypothetical protein
VIPNLPFSEVDLRREVNAGYVTIRQHPTEKLFIFNYTAKAQYAKHWNDVTQNCRGLILDDNYQIVARPFGKIFNYTEIVPDKIIYSQRPIVNDKLDGSLGIAVPTTQGWQIATRGSFDSDQAKWASGWLNETYPQYDQSENITCLFEIIYPDNRICVDYGERAELVLIAAINNCNGADFPLQAVSWWKGAVVDQIPNPSNIDEAYRYATSNEYASKEGLVCTWFKYNEPSFRLKIKHPDYVRLHQILFNLDKLKIWNSLSQNKDILSVIADIPDEFYSTIKQMIVELNEEYEQVEQQCSKDFLEIQHLSNRKDFADMAKVKSYPPVLFRMLDGKDYDDLIWKIIKPKGE